MSDTGQKLIDLADKLFGFVMPNPTGQDITKGLLDGVKSLFPTMSDKEAKEVVEKVNKNYKENLEANNGEYNPLYGLYKDTPLDTSALTSLLGSINEVAKSIIAIPKYIYESALKSPSTVAYSLIGIIGLLFIFKKGR